MFFLVNAKSGATVLRKHGGPFVYSVRWLAKLGKKALEAQEGAPKYKIMEVGK